MSPEAMGNEDPPSLDGESQSTLSSLPSTSLPPPSEVATDQHVPIENPPSDFDVDKALSGMLMGLSLETRLTIEEEIHGVISEKEESPTFLEEKLQEFDRLLMDKKTKLDCKQNLGEHDAQRRFLLRNVISTHGNNNTNAATPNNNSCYLNDPNVRLRFLRSESFDVPKAVERMICFLQFTSELYGDFVAERPISVSDFSKQEDYFLRHSRSQYLPFRDRSGRRVQIGVGSINFNYPAHIRFKIMMLLQWVVSEDIETQRKGIVIVLWPFDEQTETTNTTTVAASPKVGTQTASDPDNEHNWENIRQKITNDTYSYFQKYNNSSPVRVASIHQFYEDTPLNRALSALYVFYGLRKEHWSLYRCHFGEEIELRYKLANFGIPEELMPMTTTGKVKTDCQSNWVTMLKAMEEQKKRKELLSCDPTQELQEIVECPSSNDVVFRKGRPLYRRNPGNMYYRELIAAASFQHSEAARSGKYAITWKIVKEIESSGGRFLEWTSMGHGSGGMWIVMTDRKAIRDKIASALKQYNRDNLKNRSKTKQDNKTKTPKSPRQQSVVSPTSEMGQQDQTNVLKKNSNTAITASTVLSGATTANPSYHTSTANFEAERSRPFMFVQPEHSFYDGTTKRRRVSLACGDIGSHCLLDNDNANGIANFIANNSNRIPGNPYQCNNPNHNHKMNSTMGVFDMNNDSSCFGRMFFPTL